MAAIARDRFGLEVAVGEIRDLDVGGEGEQGGDFSAVTFYNVLAHIRDPIEALRTTHRLLRPGGVVVVETWDAESPTVWPRRCAPFCKPCSIRANLLGEVS